MKKRFIFLLSTAFFLSRIPFLNLGFGSDLDSWVYADASFAIFKTGKYFASRGIGFPLYEFLNALILKIDEMTFSGNWILPNIATMLSTLACIIFFKKILDFWKIDNKAILLIAFTFMPIIWKNSTNTMDYMVSLMFILLSNYLILQKRYTFGAMALGFAVGFRPTNGVILFPLVYLIWKENRAIVFRFIIIFSTISFSFFIPFLSVYKVFTLTEYKNYMYPPSTLIMDLMKIGYRMFYEFLGFNAAVFLFILLLFSKKRWGIFFQSLKERDRVVIFLTITAVVFLALFFKYPFQPEYLIPLIPYGLILAGKFFSRKNLAIFATLVITNGFFIIPGINFGFSPEGKVNSEMSLISEGPFFTETEKRKEMVNFKKIFPSITQKKHSIIVWHEYQAIYVYFNRYQIFDNGSYFDSKRHLVCLDYVYEPKKDLYMTYLALGELSSLIPKYNIYYIPCSVRLVKSRSNIDLLKYKPVLLRELKPLDY